MVESQLRTSDVNDVAVVAAMAAVPREAFVPQARQAMAYIDRAIPLTAGRAMNPPLATGRLLTQAQILPTDSVLLIGAAGGYAAALLSRLAARVVAVEEDATLAAHARTALAGLTNVTLVEGALNAGAPAHAPYDLIFVDGAVEALPQSIIDQLTDDGRVATGIIDNGVTRLCLGRKSGGAFGLTHFADNEAVILPGFVRPRAFRF